MYSNYITTIARMRTTTLPILPSSCYMATQLAVAKFAATICACLLQDLKEGMYLDGLITIAKA